MLVFTRKLNEAIVIGDGVEVRVLRVGRSGVRLGINAPPQVPIHRQEIYEQICRENQAAAQAGLAAERVAAQFRTLLESSAPTPPPE